MKKIYFIVWIKTLNYKIKCGPGKIMQIFVLYPISGPATMCRLLSQWGTISVADPGCLSRIPDPDFYPSRIPDLGSPIQKQQQKREVKKISCHTFLCSHKFHKIANYFSFEVLKKKIWANFQKL
jgi:hypothetical protein